MAKYCVTILLALGSTVPASAGSIGCFGFRVNFGGCGGFDQGCYGSYYGWQPVANGCYGGGWQTAGSWQSAGFGCNGAWQPVGRGCYGGQWQPVMQGCYGGGWQPVMQGCYGGGWSSGYASVGPWRPVVRAAPGYQAESVTTEPTPAPPAPRGTPTSQPGGDDAPSDADRVPAANNRPAPPRQDSAAAEAEDLGPPEDAARGPAPATVLVSLPQEARLTVNGRATRSNSLVRRFVTPPLEPGKDFHYTLEAEIDHQGRSLTARQRVTVRAGEQKQVALEFRPVGVARR